MTILEEKIKARIVELRAHLERLQVEIRMTSTAIAELEALLKEDEETPPATR